MRALVEVGVGCVRALVVDGARAVEAFLEPEGEAAVGDVWEAPLADVRGGAGAVMLPGGAAAVAAGASEGARVAVRVVRAAVVERGRAKAARVELVGPAAGGGGVASRVARGPGLEARLRARGLVVERVGGPGVDALEDAGWSEVLEAARAGVVAFAGGALRFERTAAFEAVDVDGHLAPPALAVAAARAVADAVRLFDLGGSIVVDFPTVADRAVRAAVGDVLDAALPPPFERTAMNGFGLVQIVRPRARPSLRDRVLGAPARSAALELLRRAGREAGPGAMRLVAHRAVVAVLEAEPAWLAALARAAGRAVDLASAPGRAIWDGDVETVRR